MNMPIDLSPQGVQQRQAQRQIQKATENTQRAIAKGQQLLARMGLESLSDQDHAVLGHMAWLIWVPVMWQMLDRIEELEAKLAEKN